MAANPALECAKIQGATFAGDLAAIPEDGQCGNASDGKTGRESLLDLGIDLEHADTWFEVDRRLMEIRRHHSAGATPRGPEVDYHRQVVA